jgi:hypothetical protein
MSKDKLREMLAQAVRNTQPELNRVQAVPVSEPEAKPRGRPTTRLSASVRPRPARVAPKVGGFSPTLLNETMSQWEPQLTSVAPTPSRRPRENRYSCLQMALPNPLVAVWLAATRRGHL